MHFCYPFVFSSLDALSTNGRFAFVGSLSALERVNVSATTTRSKAEVVADTLYSTMWLRVNDTLVRLWMFSHIGFTQDIRVVSPNWLGHFEIS